MIINISLTVIDLNIDSSLILDFFILDLLSFRTFSFVGSPELVDIVKQESGFRWFLLSEFLLFLLILLFLVFLLLLLILLLLLFFLDFTLLILLLFVFFLLNITWHFSILLLSLSFLGELSELFLHWVWLLLTH